MRLEARRIAVRLGARLAPVVIGARSHDEREEARQWAEWAAARLALDEPCFVAGLEVHLIPDVLLALAQGHVLSAVPVAVSFVDAPRSSTRAAAREALATVLTDRFDSLWVARDAFGFRTGELADLDWGWRRTLERAVPRPSTPPTRRIPRRRRPARDSRARRGRSRRGRRDSRGGASAGPRSQHDHGGQRPASARRARCRRR